MKKCDVDELLLLVVVPDLAGVDLIDGRLDVEEGALEEKQPKKSKSFFIYNETFIILSWLSFSNICKRSTELT